MRLHLPRGWTLQEPVAGDASGRRFFRLRRAEKTAIWMVCGGVSAPGHALEDFVRLREWMAAQGVSVPEIYEVDTQIEAALMEDFGTLGYRAAIKAGQNAQTLYDCAAQAMQRLQSAPALPALPDFYESAVAKGHVRVMDWYVPAVTGRPLPEAAREAFLSLWVDMTPPRRDAEKPCFVHVDFHADNLIWLADRQGMARCGVLDFQGAMAGPAAYDWVCLFEDARFDAPRTAALEAQLRDPGFAAAFDYWAMQFHCRVIGQFIKLALRAGKADYLSHIPRLERYIALRLQRPGFAPLRAFFEDLGVRFDTQGRCDYAGAGKFISAVAF